MSTGKHRIGLYPGTFDPITLGHLDIVRRAVKLVDTLVIGVATNPGKGPAFSPEERREMVIEATREYAGETTIDVRIFDKLLMHYAADIGAGIVIRGLRAASDFEYEYQMVGMNQRLNSDIEMVFLMADPARQFIASKLVKEIAKLGGEVAPFVTPKVAQSLKERFA